MWKNKLLLIVVGSLGGGAFGQTMGFITPASLTMTISGISLLDTSDTSVSLVSTSQSVTFSDSDTDFAQNQLASLTVPEGRYVGLQVAYSDQRTITFKGHPYWGKNGSQGSDGQYVCSTSNGYAFQASAASCTSPQPFTITINGGANRTYFNKTLCVTTAAKQSSFCQADDQFLDGSVAANMSVNIMMDLYNNLQLDADQTAKAGVMSGNSYPIVVFGGLGAAVHLSNHTNGTNEDGEVTLVFDPNKTLVYSYTFQTKNSTTPQGICDGPSFEMATAVPAGKLLNSWGLTWIGLYDAATGKVAYVANDAVSKDGINVFGDIRQPAGTSIAMNCYPDSDNANLSAWDSVFSAYLGYTYAAQATSGNVKAGNATIKVMKVTDPAGILAVSGCGNGVTTNCGAYPN